MNRLPVGKDNHGEDRRDDERNGTGQAERADADQDQDTEDFLGRVGHG
jgi:hypothetical protein